MAAGDVDNIGGHGHNWFDPAEYYDQVGEALMLGFIGAFSNYTFEGWSFTHPTTPQIAQQIRALLQPIEPSPPPPPPPPPPPLPDKPMSPFCGALLETRIAARHLRKAGHHLLKGG